MQILLCKGTACVPYASNSEHGEFDSNTVLKIIEYSKLGNIYNNKILQTIYTILTKIIDSNKKIVIILTSSNDLLMDMLELNILCTYSYTLFDIPTDSTQNKLVSTYFKEKKFIN